MFIEEHERQSRIWSPSPPSITSSSESEIDGAQQAEEAEFDAHELVRSFKSAAMRTMQQSLNEPYITVSVVAGKYIDCL